MVIDLIWNKLLNDYGRVRGTYYSSDTDSYYDGESEDSETIYYEDDRDSIESKRDLKPIDREMEEELMHYVTIIEFLLSVDNSTTFNIDTDSEIIQLVENLKFDRLRVLHKMSKSLPTYDPMISKRIYDYVYKTGDYILRPASLPENDIANISDSIW